MPSVPARRAARRRRRPIWLMVALVLAALVTACGGTSSPTPVASAIPASPAPKPTSWPGPAVLAIIKLGGADGEIAKAGRDFTAAADASDVAALWGAADGLVPVLEDLIPSVDPLEQWDMTAELGTVLRKAYPLMLEGATLLRDSIIAGDVSGVEDGSRKLVEGLAAYAPGRPILADLVPQALLQQRHYNL